MYVTALLCRSEKRRIHRQVLDGGVVGQAGGCSSSTVGKVREPAVDGDRCSVAAAGVAFFVLVRAIQETYEALDQPSDKDAFEKSVNSPPSHAMVKTALK